jgi:hypothetical protein
MVAAALGTVVFVGLFIVVLGGGNTAHPPANAEAGATQLASGGEGGVKVQGRASLDDDVNAAEKALSRGDAPEAIKILFPLEQASPHNARVHRDLERAYASEHDTRNMLLQAQRWLADEPTASSDPGLIEDLRAAATGKDEADVAFGLLEGPMGAAGVDALYEIAFGGRPPPTPVALRARQALLSAETRAHASPAALVALDLQHATGCDGRRGLLPRAKEFGDARSLTILSAFTPTTGCGFLRTRDCWPCLHRDGLLNATLGAITARVNASP